MASGSGQLSASQVEQAKEAISVLSSLISTPQGPGATTPTSSNPPPPGTSTDDDDDFQTRHSKGILILCTRPGMLNPGHGKCYTY